MARLNVGDKYLSIQILGNVRVAAFKNLDKKSPKEPDYKGDGIAIWIQTKKAPVSKRENYTTEDLA